MLRIRCLPFAAIALGVLGAVPALADVRLVSHRAVYELSLTQARETGGVRAVSGRLAMVYYENACEGAKTVYRQVMTMDSENGQRRVLDYRSTTTETDERFSFTSRMLTDNADSMRVAGHADKDGDGVQVTLTAPEAREVELDAGPMMFPMEHVRAVLDAARKGESIVLARVYDGSDPGDTAMDTFALIGERRPLDEAAAELFRSGKVEMAEVWPVTVSFYEDQAAQTDQAPKFVYTADMLENGVVSRVSFDYMTFAVEGRLVQVDAVTPAACP